MKSLSIVPLRALFDHAGPQRTEVRPIEVPTLFKDFTGPQTAAWSRVIGKRWWSNLGVLGHQRHAATERPREENMAWIVSKVQDSVSLEDDLPSRPGFVIQQEGSSPTLMLVFEDKKTAEECANAMNRIFDKAVGIRGQI
jgi:hypothetical protein